MAKKSASVKPDPKPAASVKKPLGYAVLGHFELPETTLVSLRIDEIHGWQSAGPDRWENEREDEAKTHQLAVAINETGQLQPIMVEQREDGEYDIVFGRRRCRAMQLLKKTQIKALVTKKRLPHELKRAIIAQENIQRDNLSPVEESMAIRDLIDLFVPELVKGMTDADAHHPAIRRKCIPKVAAALGQSEEWVKERYYIAALGPVGCSLVRQGRLPLPHAREIAKVLDAERREGLAIAYAIGGAEGTEHEAGSLDDLRQEVSRKLMSLAAAPWKLDATVADIGPCTECPKNSANAPGLFDGTSQAVGDSLMGERAIVPYHTPKSWDKLHEDGVCRDLKCFRLKLQASKKAISAYAAKAVDAEKAPPAPTFVDRGELNKAVKKKRERAEQAKGMPKTSSAARNEKDWEQEQAERAWREKIADQIDKKIEENPWSVVYANLFLPGSIKDAQTLKTVRDADENLCIGELRAKASSPKLPLLIGVNAWSLSNKTIAQMAALYDIKADDAPLPKKAVRK